jgi:hypothetical protein
MLNAVEGAIMAQLTGNMAKYSVGNQSFEKLPISELREMRKDLRRRIGRSKDSGRRVAGV